MNAASRNRYLFPALLVAVVFLLYGRSITFDFVNYDDYDLVVRNTEFLKDPGNILTSFTTPRVVPGVKPGPSGAATIR